MQTISCRNVNDGLPQALNLLRVHGVQEDSRNGPVLKMPCPVSTVFAQPMERVLFAPWRDANPFFHAVEAAWMLAGRDDLKQLTPYVKRMAEYSDDGGVTQPAAYGKRWRDHFLDVGDDHDHFPNFDQLNWAVRRLRKDPMDRRVVISMWDASHDPHQADLGSRDVPCNLMMIPQAVGGKLNLTVFNRSHDVIWGLFGANVVHFSVAQEYIAGRLGLGVGTLTFVSTNFHAYLATMPEETGAERYDPYSGFSFPFSDRPAVKPEVEPYSMWTDWGLEFNGEPFTDALRGQTDASRERMMQEDLRIFFDHSPVEAATKARMPWLRRVLVPMALAHRHWCTGRGEARYTGALEILERCVAQDWRLAATQWIQRRYDRWKAKADDGVSYDD